MTRERKQLTRYAWLSIAAAIVTIALKVLAWRLTNSVGLLSDAAESVVNLVAAVVALVALLVAAKRPDRNHHFGHHKAEYFSAVIEGVMIFVAAAVIVYASVDRIISPQPIERIDIGLLIVVAASVVNGVVAVVLIRAGKQYRSATLAADGKHLLTDVWTSVGVLVGVGLVWATGWQIVDPIVGLAVGVNIMVTGWRLVSDSTAGLMDVSLPKEDNARVREILDQFVKPGEIAFHAVRTRESGAARFMECHLLVPGNWTVQSGHDLSVDVESALYEQFPEMNVLVHLEPIEDPESYADMELR